MTISTDNNLEKQMQTDVSAYDPKLERIYNNGLKHYNNQEWKNAYKLFLYAACKGHPLSQYAVGYMTFKGQGTDINLVEGVSWLQVAMSSRIEAAYILLGQTLLTKFEEKAILQKGIKVLEEGANVINSTHCMYMLSEIYRGDCTPIERDINKYFYWTLRAADNGEVNAKNEIAYMYNKGLGCEKSHSRALYWYHKAAQRNSPLAEYRLGEMYELGIGIAANLKEAKSWYKKSARHGFRPASRRLKIIGM